MQIEMYLSGDVNDQGIRERILIKTISLEYVPQIGSMYVDLEDSSVYSINNIYFTSGRISVLVGKQAEERIDNVRSLFK